MQPNAITVTGTWRGDLNSQVLILELEEAETGM